MSAGLASAPREPARPRSSSALGRWRDSTFSSLAIRDFRLLFQGNLVTSIGFWMQQVAFGWLVLDLTNSPFYLGLAGFFRALPMLIISPFGGVLADRLDRRKVLIATQASMMAISLVLAILVVTRWVTPWQLLVASFLMGTTMSTNMPARQALVSQIVGREQLGNAIALNSMSMNSSRIIGPTIAGALIGVAGVAACLFLQAIGYVWSIFNLLAVKEQPRSEGARRGSFLQNLVEGFRYCYQEKTVFAMLVMAAVPTIFGMPYMQLLPAFARDVLGTGAGGLGLMLAGVGVGALTGSVLVASFGRASWRGTALLGSAIAFGVLLCLFSFTRSTPLALLALAGAGGCNAVYMALNNTIIQEVVPDHLRGRVMSVYMITFGLMPLGTLPAGAIAEVHGTPVAIFLGGLTCCVVGAAILLAMPRFRRV